jgi:peptidyl-prolyl cis-trans isomerase D
VPHAIDIIKAAFASDVGVDNDPLDAEGGYIWYDIAAVTPARPRNLDEVKADVEQRWRNDEISLRLKSKADELVDKLNHGETFAAAASASGVKPDTAKNLKRGVATGSISASMTDAVFRTAKGAYGSAASDDSSQWIVFRVTDVKTPTLDEKSRDSERLTQAMRQELSADLTGQYVARLEDDLGTSVNAAMLAQATGNSAPDRE